MDKITYCKDCDYYNGCCNNGECPCYTLKVNKYFGCDWGERTIVAQIRRVEHGTVDKRKSNLVE